MNTGLVSFFVVGTDTGVGKTTVSLAILHAARARGLRCLAMKPVESGCVDGKAADATALQAAAGGGLIDDVCPYRLAEPAAPSVAAAREGVAIDLGEIHAAYTRLASSGPELLVVEGAGGLLVPVAPGLLMSDLVHRLGLPVMVVARDALGTINHTLLTVEVAEARGLRVKGVVLSAGGAQSEREEVAALQNLSEIERELRGRAPVLGRLPDLGNSPTPQAMAAAAESSLDLDAILTD